MFFEVAVNKGAFGGIKLGMHFSTKIFVIIVITNEVEEWR
jgi:hypothetical protein